MSNLEIQRKIQEVVGDKFTVRTFITWTNEGKQIPHYKAHLNNWGEYKSYDIGYFLIRKAKKSYVLGLTPSLNECVRWTYSTQEKNSLGQDVQVNKFSPYLNFALGWKPPLKWGITRLYRMIKVLFL